MRTQDWLVIGGAALLFGGLGYWAFGPTIRNPELIKEPEAITAALGDAVAENLVRTTKGASLFLSRRATPPYDYDRTRPLCSATAIRGAEIPDQECRFSIDAISLDCRNTGGCAALKLDPTVLRDPALAASVRASLEHPAPSSRRTAPRRARAS